VRQDDRHDARVLADYGLSDRHRSRSRLKAAGRTTSQLDHRERQSARLGRVGEEPSGVVVGRVPSAHLGEQVQRLGRARVDGGREQEDGQEGGGDT